MTVVEKPQCTKLNCCYGYKDEGHDEVFEYTDKLFVYGIFLSQRTRDGYGMKNPVYAVVPDYTTVHRGGSIVKAVKVLDAGLGLTGLLVDLPIENWEKLDDLEHGYERIKVKTIDGEEAYMYAAPRSDASER